MSIKHTFYTILFLSFTLMKFDVSWAQGVHPLHTTGVVLNNDTYRPITGAKVTLVNRKTGKSVEMKTTSNGNFKFPIAPSAQYVLSAEMGGYAADPTYISTAGESNLKVYNFIMYINFAHQKSNQKPYAESDEIKLDHAPTQTLALPLLEGTFEAHPDLRFVLKIGEFVQPLPLDAEFLQAIQDDMKVERMENGWVSYTVGKFSTYQEAVAYQKKLMDNGYVDMEVLAYQQEKQVDISQLVTHHQAKELGEGKLVSER